MELFPHVMLLKFSKCSKLSGFIKLFYRTNLLETIVINAELISATAKVFRSAKP